jgi:methylated-DNA-[protein]-cysteine S-methyltransferase
MFYTMFETAAGWVGILDSGAGLRRATLPQLSRRAAYVSLGDGLKDARETPERFAGLMERYQGYFNGQRVYFPDALDLNGATSFQRAVWQAARGISYGQTRSYAWVAERVGNPKALRAAGQALAVNPLPIIVPCHRVLSADGKLGGFSGGLQMKRLLLKLEANPATNNKSNIR